MKKNLFLALAMLVGFSACQKENQKTNSVNTPALGARHLSLAPAYTDMTLNSDGSYTAYWNDCLIRVTSPAWDQVKYPTLANGVPVLAGTLTTYDGTSSVDVANSGVDGNVFQVTQRYGLLSEFNSDAFNSDFASYGSAIQTWMGNGANPSTRPHIENYIKDTYTMTVGTDQVKTYTGKLIRVTTGSHLAIATVSYALPTATTVPGNPITAGIYDAAYNKTYALTGSYNQLTSAKINYTSYVISGTYRVDYGLGRALAGTIIRADGTKFDFNVYQDF